MQLRLQARISGYSGKPVTVYAIYDSESHTCIIGKIGAANAPKQSGGILIADTEINERDDIYAESDILPSITDFYDMHKAGEIQIRDSVMAADPRAAIEFDGIKNGSKEYRVMPTVTNSQIATLSIARHIRKSLKIEDSLSMLDGFNALLNGDSITV